MIISRLSELVMEGCCEIITLLEFCREELRIDLCSMKAGLTGIAILELTAKDFSSLTVLEMIEFCTEAGFLMLLGFSGSYLQLET